LTISRLVSLTPGVAETMKPMTPCFLSGIIGPRAARRALRLLSLFGLFPSNEFVDLERRCRCSQCRIAGALGRILRNDGSCVIEGETFKIGGSHIDSKSPVMAKHRHLDLA